MPWENNRPTHVPTKIRDAAIFQAGGRCTAKMRDGSRCIETTNLEADEITQWFPGRNLTVNDIQILCGWHHNKKTQGEARAARAKLPPRTTTRPPEAHPGLN